ncbi:hypothetical protein BC830DRAFT_1174431 [Chytriomyces sp. MP71]|nr:hypothetical protein BC830DRAFT_1174431 [Chytriomyces sp. MP71]
MLVLTLVSFALTATAASAQVSGIPPGSLGNPTCEANFNLVLAALNRCGFIINPNSKNPVLISGDPATATKCLCTTSTLSILDSMKTSCSGIQQVAGFLQQLPSLDSQCANVVTGSPIPSMPLGPVTEVPSGSSLPQVCQDAENTALQTFKNCGLDISGSGISYNGDQSAIVKCICKNKSVLNNVVSACSNTPGFSSTYQSVNQACAGASSAERDPGLAVSVALVASSFLF